MSEGAVKKEEKPRKFQAIRGTRDLLPPETALWNHVEQTAHEVFATFGFGEIRVPIFEPTELFARSIGEETDVVSKEMYTFIDNPNVSYLNAVRRELVEVNLGVSDPEVNVVFLNRLSEFIRTLQKLVDEGLIGLSSSSQSNFDILKSKFNELRDGKGSNEPILPTRNRLAVEIIEKVALLQFGESVSLRPEATASVCRAYIEHGMQQLPQPVKLYYMGPMFRRERPQKGRYRQFYQIGAEVLGGSDTPKIDAEVIEMVMVFFSKLGLDGITLHVNSIGHNSDHCRQRYVAVLRAALEDVRDCLEPDSQRRIETNPLRVLDSKAKSEQGIIAKLPHIADYICDDCKKHYLALQQDLKTRGVTFEENWRLVRGLDYYMRTTFEITARGLGSQDAICGGGRYDGLVEQLGGPPTKGIGFAIGEDRLIMSLQSQGIEARQGADVLIAWKDEESYSLAQSLAGLLRDVGLSVVMPIKAMGPGEGLGLANKLGIPVGVVIGPNEVSAGVFSMKILSEGTQVTVQRNAATEVGRLLLFRVLLERAFSKLAEKSAIPNSKRPILGLLPELVASGIVPAELFPPVKIALEAFNRAAHGEVLDQEEQTRAVSNALFVLYHLSKLKGINLVESRD